MNSNEIRKQFLAYFAAHGHTVVASSSLLPADPSVLLTTAGMQQFKPYYTGDADAMKDFGSLNTTSSQKCFRAVDIDEVGDDTHNTFFEMLGNFSFGGYFKEAAIVHAYEFITKSLGLEISYVTIFKGEFGVPRDTESYEIWKSLGVTDIREEGAADVFWGPTGSGGPCGPSTEIYCRNAKGQDVEIWNNVFNEYVFSGTQEELLSGTSGKELTKLPTPGVDTGMGLERLAMIAQKTETIFDTDLFTPLLELIPEEVETRVKRIIADHGRGATFLITDGVRPSNKEGGYVLRRLLRRVMVYEYLYKLPNSLFDAIIGQVAHMYGGFYPEIMRAQHEVRDVVSAEREKFSKTLDRGMKELEKMPAINAADAFKLYESYGLPYEIIKEVGGQKADHLIREEFDAAFARHQEISRAGAEKKFGGHGMLLDTGELKAGNEEELKVVTRLHTATHLMQQALRHVLGDSVHQMGSDITAERTRFDFSFDRKLTDEEIKQVEDEVNDIIQKDVPMQKVEMPIEQAKTTGALYFFKEKYPQTVNVYYAGQSLDDAYSKEFCGGPHVTHTGEIGSFKINKEESSGAGVRRIRASVK